MNPSYLLLFMLLLTAVHQGLTAQTPTWEKLHEFGFQTESVFVTPSGRILVLVGGVVQSSDDGGGSWQNIGASPGTVAAMQADASGAIYAATSSGVFRSTDDGASWGRLNLNADVRDVLSLGGGRVIAATEGEGAQRSTDDGASWAQLQGEFSDFAWALARAGDGAIVLGTQFSGVYRSTDGGEIWREANAGMTDRIIQCFAVAPNGDLYAGTYQEGVFRSTNNGSSWVQTGLKDLAITDIVVTPGGTVAAVIADFQQAGVTISSDNGASWTTVEGTDGAFVKALAVDTHGAVYAVAANNLYRVVVGTSNVPSISEYPVEMLRLVVRYDAVGAPSLELFMGAPGVASVHVVDLNGRTVRTLVDAWMPAGGSAVAWPSEIPTGLYFCVIRSVRGPYVERVIVP